MDPITGQTFKHLGLDSPAQNKIEQSQKVLVHLPNLQVNREKLRTQQQLIPDWASIIHGKQEDFEREQKAIQETQKVKKHIYRWDSRL